MTHRAPSVGSIGCPLMLPWGHVVLRPSIVLHNRSARSSQDSQVQITRRSRHLRGDDRAVWQRNYHERIIRHGDELQRFRRYLRQNPTKGEEDRDFLGDGGGV